MDCVYECDRSPLKVESRKMDCVCEGGWESFYTVESRKTDCGCEGDGRLSELREDKLEGTRTPILGEANQTRGHKGDRETAQVECGEKDESSIFCG